MRDDDVRLTYRRRRIGEALRRFRVDLGLTQRAAGRLLEYSQASLSSYENGHRAIRPRDLKHILNEYGVTDERMRAHLLSLAGQGRQNGWWHDFDERMAPGIVDFASLESSASHARIFDPQLVTGLFQTEDYARAVISGVGESSCAARTIDTGVEFRLSRQRIHEKSEPPKIFAVLGEAALHQMIGGREVMRLQRRRLLHLGERPHIHLQILPFEVGGHPGVDGAFTILSMDSTGLLDVVGVDSLTRTWYVDEPADVERYGKVFERLQEMALSESDSRTLIERIVSAT